MKRIVSVLLVLLMMWSLALTVGSSEKTVFSDVAENRWSYEYIMYCNEKGLMTGTSADKFEPTGKTTRAMMATIVYRLAGSPDTKASATFTDVSKTAWYAVAVTWAARNKIVTGYEDKTFKPNDPITREQMATMFMRYEDYCGYFTDGRNNVSGYKDYGSVHSYALEAMEWANYAELMGGTKSASGDTILDPRGYATREQVSTLLMRFCEMTHDTYNEPVLISTYTEPDYQIVADADIYVATTGNDISGDGTINNPYATITKAKEAANTLKTEKDNVTVAVKAGTYKEQLSFNEEDGGIGGVIKYCAYGDGEVIIGGGNYFSAETYKALDANDKKMFHAENCDKIKKIDVNSIKDSLEGIDIIGITTGQTRLIPARYPNIDENGNEVFLRNDPNPKYRSFDDVSIKYLRTSYDGIDDDTIRLSDVLKERFAAYHSYENIYLKSYLMYDWAVSNNLISYNRNTGDVDLLGGNYYGIDCTVSNGRILFYNISEELDHDGEYYYDLNTGYLYVYNPSDEGVTIGVPGDLITLNGVDNLTFEKLTICGSSDNGIVGSGRCENVTVKNCVIRDISKDAVNLGCDMYKFSFVGNEVYNIGEIGIWVNGGDRQTLTSSETLIDNNLIHDFSQFVSTYRAGIKVTGVGFEISHNEIYNCPHYAITYQDSNDVIIEYNYLHDVVKCTSDIGAIYTGRRWSDYGCVIRYNLLSKVGLCEKNCNGRGVYLDDEQSGQTVYGNLFYDVAGNTFFAAGRDNKYYDNISIHSPNCPGVPNVEDGSIDTSIAYYGGITSEFGEYAAGSTLTGEALFLAFANDPSTERGNMGKLWGSLSQFDFRNGIWAEKYPSLAATSTNADDIDKADFIINNGGVVVKNNIEIGNRKNNIQNEIYEFGTVENNEIISADTDCGIFKDVINGDYTVVDKNAPQIPFAEIGRY